MTKKKAVEKLSYEEAFKELEESVIKLESGELSLEEGLGLFERGQALASRCGVILEEAELKLRKLIPDESEGFKEEDLES